MSNPQIHALVSSFATQLEAILRQEVVRSLQAALGGSVLSSGGGRIAKSGRKPRAAASAARPAKLGKAKRVRRSAAELDQDVSRLVAFVKANPGTTSEKARAALSFDKAPWIQALHRGVESKQLATKGVKRLTTLHLAKS